MNMTKKEKENIIEKSKVYRHLEKQHNIQCKTKDNSKIYNANETIYNLLSSLNYNEENYKELYRSIMNDIDIQFFHVLIQHMLVAFCVEFNRNIFQILNYLVFFFVFLELDEELLLLVFTKEKIRADMSRRIRLLYHQIGEDLLTLDGGGIGDKPGETVEHIDDIFS
jgi:hypothetical protein